MGVDGKKKILLVEDDPVIAMVEAKKLRKVGYEVLVAANGPAAIQQVETDQQIDLVLMDMDLGDNFDGSQVARTILQHHDLPIVFLTAHADAQTVARAREITRYGYVLKESGFFVLQSTLEMAFNLYNAQRAIQASELKYRTMIDYSEDWEQWVGPDGRYILVSPSFEQISGYPPRALEDNPGLLLEIVHPDDRQQVCEHLRIQEDRNYEKPGEVQFRILHRNGEVRWLHHHCKNVYGPQGDYQGRWACNRDITRARQDEQEIKQLLMEKELLLREVHHRIKNNMLTISSLLGLQAATLSDPAGIQALQEADSRVQTMMVIYDKLYRSEYYQRVDLQMYLSALLSEIEATWQAPGRRIRLLQDVSALEIAPRQCLPVGLIINEWVTNCFKYAFPDGREGVIRVTVRLLEQQQVEVRVADNGVGLPEDIDLTHPSGFGLTLVRILSHQLNGQVQVTRQDGTCYRLIFPLSETYTNSHKAK